MTSTRALRRILVLPIALLLALGIAGTAQAAPAQIPCSAAGGGHYNCSFWPEGNGTTTGGSPVVDVHGTLRGYLNQGTNWIVCQQIGELYSSHGYYNRTWAMTEANDGNWGWVSAVYASGGDNEGGFAGVPDCGGKYGLAPGATTSSPPPSTEAPKPAPAPTPAPTPAPPAPAPGTTLPAPVNLGSYGTYQFRFQLWRNPDSHGRANFNDWSAEQMMAQLNSSFSRYFTFTGCGEHLAVGAKCSLNTTAAPDAPVEVIAVAPTGFALKSRGGHAEGAGRTIEFQFQPYVNAGEVESMTLLVTAWGPLSNSSLLGPLNSGTIARGSWAIFEHNIRNRFPSEPPGGFQGPQEV